MLLNLYLKPKAHMERELLAGYHVCQLCLMLYWATIITQDGHIFLPACLSAPEPMPYKLFSHLSVLISISLVLLGYGVAT